MSSIGRSNGHAPILVGRAAAYLRYPRIAWKYGNGRARVLILATYALVGSYVLTLALLSVG